MDLATLLKRASDSGFYRWLLNISLGRMIPFNRPHHFKVIETNGNHLKVLLPYRKRNFNHIRGIHACALATVTEFTSGLLLISKLDPNRYRLIMKRLEMDYHYQGKMDAIATFTVSEEWLKEKVFDPLIELESIIVPCEVRIFDTKNNLLTTGKIFWQVKDWSKVKTKVGV